MKSSNLLNKFYHILKIEGIYPIHSNWNYFPITHPASKPDSIKEKDQINKIKNEVRNKAGLYSYFNEKNECLYVGKAKLLFNRIKSHYRESFTENAGKSHQWYEFFGKNTGQLSLYWIEIEDENVRVITERLIAILEKPLFEENTPRKR